MNLADPELVKRVAHELVAALLRGEEATNGWRDRDAGQRCVAAALDAALGQLAATGVWGPDNRLASAHLWNIAGEWLEQGEMQSRARMKPRGYAGDDLLLLRICENYHSPTPLGRLFDAYFQQHAAPQAVRNRTQIVADRIIELANSLSGDALRIASVGSGPAVDVLRAAKQLDPSTRKRLQVMLLDLDPAALEAAHARLLEVLASDQVECRRENLYRLAQRNAPPQLTGVQFISCTGFFDYLPAQEAAQLLRFLWAQVAPEGRLLVFNFAPSNPSRALMEWVANWYLIYRTDEEMHQLAQLAGLSRESYVVSAEPTGADLFIDARK